MFRILLRNLRINNISMNSRGLSPEAVNQLKIIDNKLNIIRNETRTFMEQKDREIAALQNQIKDITGNKRPSEQQSDGGTQKKIKTDPGAAQLQFTEVGGLVQVYTDGACPNNGQAGARGGVGVWWGAGHGLNLSRRVAGPRQTNNVAEIQAISLAITQAVQANISRLQVNTDSRFVIDSVTKWMPGWKKKGWRTSTGQEVKNKADFLELDAVLQTAAAAKMEIKWTHVPGHANIEGNEQADRLAVLGAQMKC